MKDVSLADFCKASRLRNREFAGCVGWTLADWFVAITGELGEAANIAKKMRRDGWSKELQAALAKELADIQGYLPLLAEAAMVDLPTATIDKFNEVSERINSAIRL